MIPSVCSTQDPEAPNNTRRGYIPCEKVHGNSKGWARNDRGILRRTPFLRTAHAKKVVYYEKDQVGGKQTLAYPNLADSKHIHVCNTLENLLDYIIQNVCNGTLENLLDY